MAENILKAMYQKMKGTPALLIGYEVECANGAKYPGWLLCAEALAPSYDAMEKIFQSLPTPPEGKDILDLFAEQLAEFPKDDSLEISVFYANTHTSQKEAEFYERTAKSRLRENWGEDSRINSSVWRFGGA
jgi:hypothetical protein